MGMGIINEKIWSAQKIDFMPPFSKEIQSENLEADDEAKILETIIFQRIES